ncbi:PAS domain S-box protein [Halorhodospira halochloris]|uniref:PAS domain-containing protein n=1 Tax=Halorhodospira halochloris TaxID=1052 RepID=UPI001EE9411E|nr:PAS domain S-box protein [Halorhodospira halochloris]
MEAKEFYNNMLDRCPAGVCALDVAGYFTYLNSEACELLGYPDAEQLLGRSFDTVVDYYSQLPQRFTVADRLALVAATQEDIRCYEPVRLKKNNAEPFAVSIDASPLRDDKSAVIGVILVLGDVMERRRQSNTAPHRENDTPLHEDNHSSKKCELELSEPQRLAKIGLGSWVWDLRTGYTFSSTEVYRSIGVEKAAFDPSQKGFLAVIHPDDQQAVEAEFEQALRDQQPWASEYRILPANGDVRIVLERGHFETDELGKPLRIIATVEDVTEQRKEENYQKQLIDILDNTSDVVALHDYEGKMIYVNTAGIELVGLGAGIYHNNADHNSPELPESVEDSILRFHPQWAADLILNEGVPTALSEGIWHGETALLNESGEEVPTSQVIIGHRDASGEVVQFSTVLRQIPKTRANG